MSTFSVLVIVGLHVRVCVCVWVGVWVCMGVYLLMHHGMRAYWGVEIYLHVFLLSTLHESMCSASFPGRFTQLGSCCSPTE
jgi:hypothetical protein